MSCCAVLADLSFRSPYVLDALAALVGLLCVFVWSLSLARHRRKIKSAISKLPAAPPFSVGVCSTNSFTLETLRITASKGIREDGRMITVEPAVAGANYDLVFVDIDHPCENYPFAAAAKRGKRQIGIRSSLFRRPTASSEAFEAVVRLRDAKGVFGAVGATQAADSGYTPLPLLIFACALAIGFIALLVVVFIKGL